MSNSTSHMYAQEKLANTQPHVITLTWDITGAKATSPLVAGQPTLDFFDATTAATVDAFLGASGAYADADFDATSMGVDAWAAVVHPRGEIERLVKAVYKRAAGGATATIARHFEMNGALGLSDSTLENGCEIGADGSAAIRVVDTGLDAATDGTITVELHVLFK